MHSFQALCRHGLCYADEFGFIHIESHGCLDGEVYQQDSSDCVKLQLWEVWSRQVPSGSESSEAMPAVASQAEATEIPNKLPSEWPLPASCTPFASLAPSSEESCQGFCLGRWNRLHLDAMH